MNEKKLDLTFVRMIQEQNELEERNRRAAEYSASCRKAKLFDKEDILCAMSALSMFAFIGALYFLCCII